MAIKFSQFVVETSAATMSHIVGYDGADNIQITPNNFFTSFVTGTAGQVPFFGSTTSLLGDDDFSWDNTNKRLGIGNTSPASILHINTGTGLNNANTVIVDRPASSDYSAISFATAGTVDWSIGQNSANNLEVFEDGQDAKTRLTIETGGNVGIGTSSPGTTLDVFGTLASSGITQLGTGGSNVLLTSAGAGNVGIGTSSPAAKLDVNINDDGITDLNALILKRTWANPATADRSHGILFSDFNSSMATIYADRTNSATNFNSDLLFATNTGTNGLSLSTKMIIKNTGNVGIGTSSPASKLSIDASAQDTLAMNTSDGDGPYAVWRRQGSSIGFVGNANALSSSGNTNFGVRATNDLVFAAGGASEKMRIASTGNVGIGTTSPNFKLSVDDNTITTSPTTLLQFDSSLIDDNGGYNIDFRTSSNDTANRFVARIQALRSSGAKSSLGFFTETGSALTRALLLDSSQNATFSGSITTNLSSEGTYFTGGSGGVRQLSITSGTNTSAHALHTFNIESTNGLYKFDVNSGTSFKLDSSVATFNTRVVIGDDAITTDKPGLVVGDTTNNGQITIRGGQPTLFFDKSGVNDAVILTDGVSLKFKNGTLDSEGSDQLTLDTSGNAIFSGDILVSAAGSTGEIIRTTDNTEPYFALQRNSGSNGVGVLRLLDGGDLAFDTGATGAGQTTRLTIDGGNGNATFENDVNIVNTSGVTLNMNTNTQGNTSKILLHEGTTATPQNGASIRYDGSANQFKIGVGTNVDTIRLTIARDTGNVGIGTTAPTSKLTVVGLAEHADNAAAISAGLTTGAFYRTGDLLKVVH